MTTLNLLEICLLKYDGKDFEVNMLIQNLFFHLYADDYFTLDPAVLWPENSYENAFNRQFNSTRI